MNTMRRLLMCAFLIVSLFSAVAHAELVVIGGIGTIIERSLIAVEPASLNGKMGFLVWALQLKSQPIARISCEDAWNAPRAQQAAVSLAKHINTSDEIQFARVLMVAGLSGCQQENAR